MVLQPITYEVDTEKAQRSFCSEGPYARATNVLIIVLLVLLGSAVVFFDNIIIRVIAGVLMAILLLIAGVAYFAKRLPPPEDFTGEQLELDIEGVSHWDGDRRVQRRWPEVSEFMLVASPDNVGDGMIAFNESGKARMPGIFRWITRQGSRHRLAVIEDIYDAPIVEIAAKLNEYRDRALASGPGAAGSPG